MLSRLSFAPSWPASSRRLLAALVLLHAALGAALGLSVDEAHYLLYAAHPALSYFDHPPLVGWVQWPLVALDAPVALLRLLPGLVWLATAALAYRIACRWCPNPAEATHAGHWTLLALALAPLLHILGIGLLPDTLLMLLALAMAYQTWRLSTPTAPTPGPRWSDWLLLGLLWGLAGLSKYTAFFFALASGACLLAAHGLRLLRQPGPWLACALAALLITPVLLWNAQHDWISFRYQLDHGQGNVWQLRHIGSFLLLQAVLYGPLLGWALGGWRRVGVPSTRWMLAFFALPFGILAYMAGGGTSLPHWTAPAWVALAPLAGIGLAHHRRTRGPRLLYTLAALQALVCAGLLGLMLSAGRPLVAPSAAEVAPQPNPMADLHGWAHAGAQARQLAAQHHLGSLAVQNWTLASRLGWYARPLPVHVLDTRFDQFDLWAGDLPSGADTLLVDWSHMPYTLPIGQPGFRSCTLLATQETAHWGSPIASFRFYACRGWLGPAAPQLRTPS